MTFFDTDPIQLQVSGARLRDIGREAHEALASLRADVTLLLGGAWTGGAADRFTTGWEHWHAAAVDALAVLDELGTAVITSGRSYADFDATVERLVAASGLGL